MNLLREFKPALVFLGKFLALYFIGNILYGIYIENYWPRPDRLTRVVTAQTSWVLNRTGFDTTFEEVVAAPKVALKNAGDVVLYVYEGCNGINVMVVFIAFLFAFGGDLKRLFLFFCSGILIIHVFNLLRISLLFQLALTDSSRFHYYHKYFFTATLYLVVFCLWAVWVINFSEKRQTKVSA